MSVFYVYTFDEQMGSGFIKICSYFPYPVKVFGKRARVGPSGRRTKWRTCWTGSSSCPDVSRPTRHMSNDTGGFVVARLVSPSR